MALRLGLVPVPAAQAWGGMAASGVLIAAVRTGVIARLAQDPATAAEVASELSLDPIPARLLLDSLCSAGYARERDGRYRLSRVSSRWLDPRSPRSVAGYVAGTADYWHWWQGLDQAIRTGTSTGSHGAAPDDPYWRRYMTGQYELARLSAAEVARKLPLPPGPRALLDIGGGHGWYSAQLCRRYPTLSATVLDLPGSAAIGREVIAEAGLADRVSFRDGDATMADLGSGYDAILCFNLVHHLTPAEVTALFRKARAALAPRGALAVLDVFADAAAPRRGSVAASTLALFFYLSSGARVHTRREVEAWLAQAGFAPPKRVRILGLPGLSLQVAHPAR